MQTVFMGAEGEGPAPSAIAGHSVKWNSDVFSHPMQARLRRDLKTLRQLGLPKRCPPH